MDKHVIQDTVTRLMNKYKRYGKVDVNPEEWTVEIYNQAPGKPLGFCRYGTCTIGISKYLLDKPDMLKDTLIHEVAHALIGIEVSPRGNIMHHGKSWKNMMVIMGGNPRATAKIPYEDRSLFTRGKNTSSIANTQAKPKWVIVSYINGIVKLIGNCNRRLKDLEKRMVRNDRSTLGNIWLIDTNHFDKYRDNNKELARFLVR